MSTWQGSEHEQKAKAEGWNIFKTIGHRDADGFVRDWQIQILGDGEGHECSPSPIAEHVVSDDAARRLVRAGAEHGVTHHVAAMSFLAAESPVEHAEILACAASPATAVELAIHLRAAYDLLNAAGGKALALAMTGPKHPNFDDLLMGIQQGAQTISQPIARALGPYSPPSTQWR